MKFLLAGVFIFWPLTALGSCPCYTHSSTYNTHNCGVEAAPGTNPTTLAWQPIFALVAGGPSAWGAAGPAITDIGQGCGQPEPNHKVPAVFPCELLKAIAMNESGWRQFCVPTTPADQTANPTERTIISFDCGYGIGQVTSGMHTGDSPAFDPARVAAEPAYNLATGAKILADKWRATKCVGDNQPRIIEDWYSATWAYNGLAWSNNPNNPNLDSARGVYDPKVGGSYTYQERIFGYAEHPPSLNHWSVRELAYPDRANISSDPTTGKSPPALPEPSCASPTDCINHRSVHVTQGCSGESPPDMMPFDSAGIDSAGLDSAMVDGAKNDQGYGELPDPSGGCGCHLSGTRPPRALPLALLLLAVGVVNLRRRLR